MRKITLLLLGLSSFLFASSQSVTGNWEGALDVNGMELPVVFHFVKDSTGKLTGTMDSPKQMAYGLKCSKVSMDGDSIHVEMRALGVKYDGLADKERKNITGNFSQGGMQQAMDILKTGDEVVVKEIKRPQTPKPPFFYNSEDVIYQNADKSIQFGATFTFPLEKVAKKYPAVILITGSGQEDRDETIFEHKPFAVIADYLTKHGIAVLRVDDRGKGKTTGDVKNATSADFANDVEAGIDYLKTRPEVDINKIGLLGHSEGGMIAPMVASRRKDVKFIVLLAGPGVPVIELMEQQTLDVLASDNIARNELEQFRPFYRSVMAAAIQYENDSAAAAKKIAALFAEWKSKTDATVIKHTANISDQASLDAFTASVLDELKQPWYNYFIKYKPADYLSKVKCAVLALNGEKDIQVSAVPNTEAIRKIMVDKMVKSFKVQVLPGLNHLFQHCKTCSAQEYGELEETFAPEALQIIGDWIQQQTK